MYVGCACTKTPEGARLLSPKFRAAGMLGEELSVKVLQCSSARQACLPIAAQKF